MRQQIAAFYLNPSKKYFGYALMDENFKLKTTPIKVNCLKFNEDRVSSALKKFFNRVKTAKTKGRVRIEFKTTSNGSKKPVLAKFVNKELNRFIKQKHININRAAISLKGKDLIVFNRALKHLKLTKRAKANTKLLSNMLEVATHTTKANLHKKLKELYALSHGIKTWTPIQKLKFAHWLIGIKSGKMIKFNPKKLNGIKVSIKTKSTRKPAKRRLIAKTKRRVLRAKTKRTRTPVYARSNLYMGSKHGQTRSLRIYH